MQCYSCMISSFGCPYMSQEQADCIYHVPIADKDNPVKVLVRRPDNIDIARIHYECDAKCDSIGSFKKCVNNNVTTWFNQLSQETRHAYQQAIDECDRRFLALLRPFIDNRDAEIRKINEIYDKKTAEIMAKNKEFVAIEQAYRDTDLHNIEQSRISILNDIKKMSRDGKKGAKAEAINIIKNSASIMEKR